MSLKVLQFPAQGSLHTTRARTLSEALGSPRDMAFVSSWLEDDSEPNRPPSGPNWGAISGLALSLAISAGFWATVGVIVERLLR